MKPLFCLFLLLYTLSLKAQDCNCLENFEAVVTHIEANYAGIADKITSANQQEYQTFLATSRQKAKQTRQEAICLEILMEYIAFFQDGHIQLTGRQGLVTNRFLYPNYAETTSDITGPAVAFEQRSAQTAYLKIRTFYEGFYTQIDSTIRVQDAALRKSKNLIIDLRGNDGGAVFTYQRLLPYLGLDTIQFIGFDVYATPANIAAYERQLESPYIPENQKFYIRQNIERMRAGQGKLVSLSGDYFQVIEQVEGPQRIAVLIDNNCGSTAEHFLLVAQQSDRVVLMGEPTIGMYDYGDMRPINLPSIPYRLWCATTRSRRLDRNLTIDNIGIQPTIPLNRNKDWIREAQDFLEDDQHHYRSWLDRR
ncbi:MAG: S41 family peptidase [Bacteroidota bacterium]